MEVEPGAFVLRRLRLMRAVAPLVTHLGSNSDYFPSPVLIPLGLDIDAPF